MKSVKEWKKKKKKPAICFKQKRRKEKRKNIYNFPDELFAFTLPDLNWLTLCTVKPTSPSRTLSRRVISKAVSAITTWRAIAIGARVLGHATFKASCCTFFLYLGFVINWLGLWLCAWCPLRVIICRIFAARDVHVKAGCVSVLPTTFKFILNGGPSPDTHASSWWVTLWYVKEHPICLVIRLVTSLWHRNSISREVTLSYQLVRCQVGNHNDFLVWRIRAVYPDKTWVHMNRTSPFVWCMSITPEANAKGFASLCVSLRSLRWIGWGTLLRVAGMASTLLIGGLGRGEIPEVISGLWNPITLVDLVTRVTVALWYTVAAFCQWREKKKRKWRMINNSQVMVRIGMEIIVIASIIYAFTPRVACRGRGKECNGKEGTVEELHCF